MLRQHLFFGLILCAHYVSRMVEKHVEMSRAQTVLVLRTAELRSIHLYMFL